MDALSVFGKAIAQSVVGFGYSAQIRAEIEREVQSLLREFDRQVYVQAGSRSVVDEDDVAPDYLELGYMVNTHRGINLYSNGDTIMGIPVRIGSNGPFTITLVAEGVEFGREDYDEDDGRYLATVYDTEDVVVTSRW